MKRKWTEIENATWNRAQQLRRELATSEKLLWRQLRNDQLGARVRRQHPIGPYIVDFFVPSCKLVIELDGDSHFTPEQEAHDLRRTEFLGQQGLRVLRFQNHTVKEAIGGVIERIRAEIENTDG
ncbi:MAG: endonuclease domain-containing protein [bacterium]|nr:endonuclease domain-containing protein [bacterium]